MIPAYLASHIPGLGIPHLFAPLAKFLLFLELMRLCRVVSVLSRHVGLMARYQYAYVARDTTGTFAKEEIHELDMMTSPNGNIFPRYWPFVRGIHRSPVNSPDKGQWRGAMMFSLVCAWINGWVNNREAGDLRRHSVHYDVIVMDKHICERGNSWIGEILEGSLSLTVGTDSDTVSFGWFLSLSGIYMAHQARVQNDMLILSTLDISRWFSYPNSLQKTKTVRPRRRYFGRICEIMSTVHVPVIHWHLVTANEPVLNVLSKFKWNFKIRRFSFHWNDIETDVCKTPTILSGFLYVSQVTSHNTSTWK